MKKRRVMLLSLVMAALMVGTSIAEVPRVVSYQGRLTIDGTPVADGPRNMRFIIWDDPASTLPANEIWNSGPVTVATVDGLFSVILGDESMAPFPEEPPSDTGLWLGVTIGADPEMTPRTRLTSSVFAFRAAHADEAELAHNVDASAVDHGGLSGLAGDDHPQYLLTDGSRALTGNLNAGARKITNLSPATSPADAVRLDQVLAEGAPAGGDLTGTYPNPELASNSVGAAQIATGAVYTGEIANNTIVNDDINSKADIDPTKILGTAVNLTSTQTINGEKRFQGNSQFGDSAMFVDEEGVRIGGNMGYYTHNLLYVNRTFETSIQQYGVYTSLVNTGSGGLVGVTGSVTGYDQESVFDFRGTSGLCFADADSRRGIYGFCQARDISITTGTSIGVYGCGYDGEESIGVYGTASFASTNYAGYFSGNVNVTGSVLKSGSVTLIDHPDDPENLYLAYGSVESSDFKTMLDGAVVTDADGKAEVALPDWFEKVNEDFRYQLTVVGSFARAVVGEELINGRFVIMTDEPYTKVCWQVTGIRSDAWAKANRVQSEREKAEGDKGLYRAADALGKSPEQSVSYRHDRAAREQRANRDGEF